MIRRRYIIIERIEKRLKERLAKKYGWKRLPHNTCKKLFRTIGYMLFQYKKKTSNNKTNNKKLWLGVDEFGRSIAEEMQRYVQILMKRGIKLHTVLVLGSRAKGGWKPSSDVDVTIIASNLPRNEHYPGILAKISLKRLFLLSDIPLFIGVEPTRCCSREEFLKLLESFDIDALDAVYYGKVIYDDGFWEKAERKLEILEKTFNLSREKLKRKLFPL
jgi:predicted nucleotidyltransferase